MSPEEWGKMPGHEDSVLEARIQEVGAQQFEGNTGKFAAVHAGNLMPGVHLQAQVEPEQSACASDEEFHGASVGR